MGKERLGGIKKQLEESNSYDDNPKGYWYHNINWLIERVQVLNDEKRNIVISKPRFTT